MLHMLKEEEEEEMFALSYYKLAWELIGMRDSKRAYICLLALGIYVEPTILV